MVQFGAHSGENPFPGRAFDPSATPNNPSRQCSQLCGGTEWNKMEHISRLSPPTGRPLRVLHARQAVEKTGARRVGRYCETRLPTLYFMLQHSVLRLVAP